MAMEPSGTRVLVLCGQPGQNHGRRSVPRLSPCAVDRCFASISNQAHVHARCHIGRHAKQLQTVGDGLRHHRGRQIGLGAQQPAVGGPAVAPFAPGAFRMVVFAEYGGAMLRWVVVQLILELLLDDGSLFLDHQDFAQAVGKLTHAGRLQWPHHVDFVHADAERAADRVVQAEIEQRLAGVAIGLAAGNDAQAVVLARHHVVVETVRPNIGQRGRPLELHHAGLGPQRVIGPTDMDAALGHGEIFRQDDADTVCVGQHRCAGFDHLLNRLHAGPQPAEAAHGESMHAKIEDVLHVGGKEHRQSACHERMVTLVRERAALGHVVVAGQCDHAAQGRSARQVGVLECIAAAIHARSLAVPDAEHAVVVLAGRIELQLLRPPDGGDAEFLIDAGLEDHVVLGKMLVRLPQRLVIGAER